MTHKFTQEQQAVFDSLPPTAKLAMERILNSGDKKTICMTGATMAILSAVAAYEKKSIMREQVYDIVSCGLQLIWNEASNTVGEYLLMEVGAADLQMALAEMLSVGLPASAKTGRRLHLLVETLCKPKDC